MKKLGTIIALALVLTIGGVYATFSYAQGNATEATGNVGKQLAAATVDAEKGSILIEENTFVITVDDVGNLTTGASYSGALKVKFVATDGADQTVKDDGIKIKMTVSFGLTDDATQGLTANKYGSDDIFVLRNMGSNGYVEINGGNKVTDTAVEVDLSQYITVSSISLPTYSDYQAYKTAFDATTITVTFSEIG